MRLFLHVQVHTPKLKPARKAALEKLLQDSMSTCLERPFIEAAQADRRRSLRAMSQAWISYMATVQVPALCRSHASCDAVFSLNALASPPFITSSHETSRVIKRGTDLQLRIAITAATCIAELLRKASHSYTVPCLLIGAYHVMYACQPCMTYTPLSCRAVAQFGCAKVAS